MTVAAVYNAYCGGDKAVTRLFPISKAVTRL